MQYDVDTLVRKLPWQHLSCPIDAAGRALTRLDERLKRSPDLAEGYRTRSQLLESCAAMWLNGELIHLEDLVLHDAGADIRMPSHELTRAAHLLRLLRRAERQPPDWALSRIGVLTLAGRRVPDTEAAASSSPADGGGANDMLLTEIDALAERAEQLADAAADRASMRPERRAADVAPRNPDHDQDELQTVWLSVVADSEKLPPALAAAFILDAWLILDPFERRPEPGRICAAAMLCRHVTPNHLPALSVGLRRSPFRWRAADPVDTRLSVLLDGFERTAHEAMEQLNRLHFAREQMTRQCASCRSNSKLPALVGLFMAHPFVSIQLAKKKLGVTAAAIDRMLEQLGPALPRELTGRGRYRAWGVL